MKTKLAFISQPEYFRFTYQDLISSSQYITNEFSYHYQMSYQDFDRVIKYNADINFFFRGEYVPEPVLRAIAGIKVCISSEPFPRKINGRWVYTKDSLSRYIDFRENIVNKKFDYIFHYDNRSIDLFEMDGTQISGEFILPVSVNALRPLKRAKKWDGFFLGRSTQHREQLLGRLKHKYNFLHIAHGINNLEDISSYISQSKININMHAEKEITWEPRIQILLACGAFVLSEKLPSNTYLQPGKDYIEYTDERDLVDKFEYYLHKPNKRLEIAKNGYSTVRHELNSMDCFTKLINNIQSGNAKKFEIKKRNEYINFISKLV